MKDVKILLAMTLKFFYVEEDSKPNKQQLSLKKNWISGKITSQREILSFTLSIITVAIRTS